MKKITWIRTGLLLLVITFAVLGGNFLYTGVRNASPLEMAGTSFSLEEGIVLTQTFTPAHNKLTSVALALGKPVSADGMTGGMRVILSVHDTGAEVHAMDVPLEGMPDKWYVDLPVNVRLDTDVMYDLSVSVSNYQNNEAPSLYLVPLSFQGPEIDGNIRGVGASSLSDGESAAVCFTYDVLVPGRLTAFLLIIGGILLCVGLTFLYRRKKQGEARTVNELLQTEICRVPVVHILFFLAVTAAAVILRFAFLSVKSNDYYIAYEVWISEIRNGGGLASLGKDIGDNPPLYMTLITLASYLPFEPVVIVKIPSLIFDFVLAAVCVRLFGRLGGKELGKKLTLYAVILLNPLTLLDSAAWGQCDSLYVSFTLLMLLALCEARPWDAVSGGPAGFWKSGDGICLLFSVGLSLKLQAIFFLPVLCLIWIVQKRNLLKPPQLLWIPIIYTLSCIPMYLAGRSLKVMFKIYLGQANRDYGTLTLNYPNLYHLIGTWSEELKDGYFVYGMLLALLLLLLLYYHLYCRRGTWNGMLLCKASALSVLIICFCMPLIHERYAFAAEMLLFVVMMREARYIKVALITMLCTLFTYCTYLLQLERSFSVLPEWAVALVRLGVIFYIVRDIFHSNVPEGKDNEICC